MTPIARVLVEVMLTAAISASPSVAAAQGQAALRVTVQDETQGALIHAVVTVVDAAGVEQAQLVDQTGVAAFTGLTPGRYQVRVEAEGFQGSTAVFTVRRGSNQAIATLSVAIRENVVVRDQGGADRRDNGFTTTLSREEIDALPDDPDELADQLRQLAGPGAQFFVDGFRGGRLPPKDQIQQIRLHTNSYAAEYHDAGMVRIEIITKPGMGDWRGSFNFGFRDESLNARNAFAPVRGPEQLARFMINSQGPLAKGRTGLAIAVDGNTSYDARTIVASTPTGRVNDQIRRPVDGVNATVRLEQLAGSGTVRAEYMRQNDVRRNLGVGDFDLPTRAYETRTVADVLRGTNLQTWGKKVFSELRFEFSRSETTQVSQSDDPTIRVLDAFTSGGAGLTGRRVGRQLTIAQNFDVPLTKKHSVRSGAEFRGGWWDSSQQSNASGTFTFSSLDDFVLGRPRTYTRRVGDPQISYSQLDAGWYVQDDFRLTKNLNVGLGVRQEIQTHVGDPWNLAPRAAVTWSVGKGNVRGGWGVFYDWLESNVYEQTVLVDGTHQIDEVIISPSYPDPGTVGGTRLPPSRIQLGGQLTQPTVHQASLGYERPIGGWGQFRSDYMRTKANSVFRSVNVNAPVGGVRPDPTAGNVTEIGSTGRRASDRLNVAILLRVPERRLFGNIMYQWASARSFADSALSLPADSTNPDADWGPSSQDVRHRAHFMLNTPLAFGVRAGVQASYSSALPYTITTGLDDNGDTVFNDRPAGVARNSARGDAQWNVNLRLNRSISLGGLLGGGDGPVILGGPAGAGPQRAPGGGPGGGRAEGGESGPQFVLAEPSTARYRLDLYVQVFNLFNTSNLNAFVGNQLSPYFGQATSAAPPRRIELGASISF